VCGGFTSIHPSISACPLPFVCVELKKQRSVAILSFHAMRVCARRLSIVSIHPSCAQRTVCALLGAADRTDSSLVCICRPSISLSACICVCETATVHPYCSHIVVSVCVGAFCWLAAWPFEFDRTCCGRTGWRHPHAHTEEMQGASPIDRIHVCVCVLARSSAGRSLCQSEIEGGGYDGWMALT